MIRMAFIVYIYKRFYLEVVTFQ